MYWALSPPCDTTRMASGGAGTPCASCFPIANVTGSPRGMTWRARLRTSGVSASGGRHKAKEPPLLMVASNMPISKITRSYSTAATFARTTAAGDVRSSNSSTLVRSGKKIDVPAPAPLSAIRRP